MHRDGIMGGDIGGQNRNENQGHYKGESNDGQRAFFRRMDNFLGIGDL